MKVETDVCDICQELGRPIKLYVIAEPESGREVIKELCAEHASVLEALLEGAPLTTTIAAAPEEVQTTSSLVSDTEPAAVEASAQKPTARTARQSQARTPAKKAATKKAAAKKATAKKATARRGLQVKTLDEIEQSKNA